MYETQCNMCGKKMVYQYSHQFRRFCGKKCYGQFLKKKREKEFFGENAPRSRFIHPQGYTNLVCAIVHQAKRDVLDYAPGTPYRQDAERFFRSEYFEEITELDGKPILNRLIDQYNRKHRKKKGVQRK